MKYEATRRLYRGGGKYVDVGEQAEFEPRAAEPLLKSGAIREIKKAKPIQNKKAPAPKKTKGEG